VKLSLRWKIVGGFGLLLLLIGLLGWVTLILFGSVRGVQRRVFDNAIPGLVAVEEIVRSYTAQSGAIRGFIIGDQQYLLDQYNHEKRITKDYEHRAEGLFTAPAEKKLLRQLEAAGLSFQRLVDDHVIPLATNGNRSHAFLIMGQEAAPLVSKIENLGQQLRTRQAVAVSGAENDLNRTSNEAVLTLVLVLVGASVIGILLLLFIPGRLVRNLARLVEATRAIERGNLHQQIDIRSGDEVEELAHRFTEMQAGLERLQRLAVQERELEIAASIQGNLLNRALPDAPGVNIFPVQRQANRVGGDWYDVGMSDDELSVVIGDASGKGIGAALMATVALSALRAERALGSGPERVVARANRSLAIAGDADSFTTVVYASFDLVTGRVRWMNMGHPTPFLLRRAGDEDSELTGAFVEGARNRALGWYDDPGFDEVTTLLEPGDALILYTDGFIEAKDTEGEMFGEDRLGQAILQLAPLGPEVLGEELIGTVESFAAGKLDDDLTLLVVQFEGVGPTTADAVSPGIEREPGL
jgi:serine phosphatase RsbU (regulator of sigma subunit)/CHASE3 domain sensor protein